MTLEDDYGMIDGVINNGRRGEETEKAAESGPGKKPSIRERLEDAKKECSEHKQGGIYGTQQPQAAVTNNRERKVLIMANQIFMRVNEVAEELGVLIPYAYKLIRQLNEELAKTGCITISGRIDRKFFHEKFYGTRTEKD